MTTTRVIRLKTKDNLHIDSTKKVSLEIDLTSIEILNEDDIYTISTEIIKTQTKFLYLPIKFKIRANKSYFMGFNRLIELSRSFGFDLFDEESQAYLFQACESSSRKLDSLENSFLIYDDLLKIYESESPDVRVLLNKYFFA